MPKTFKPILSIPWSQNPRFFGRESELSKISDCISLGPSSLQQKCCVLHGMTGVGKSQTTLEFAYRSRHVFHYIFWIRAEDDAVISQEYSKLIGILGIAPADDPDAKAERVRQWLCTSKSAVDSYSTL